MGVWTRSLFNTAYVPGMFAWMIDSNQRKRAESMWKDLCTVKTSKKKKEDIGGRSGLGLPQRKGEGAGVTYDVQIVDVNQTWIHVVWALAVRITEEAIDDNLYELNGGSEGDLKELSYDIGQSLEENMEVEHSKFLNYATATTYHQTRNSKALIAADHPRLDGSTFSNYATNADTTYESFWAWLVAAENQYNHRQYKIQRKVKNVWYAPQLERKMGEIMDSPDRPDTGNRAINVYAKSGRKIEKKSWAHITDTDACFLQLDGMGIIHFDARKTRFAREKDFQTGDMMIKGDNRWSAEINDPTCFYGNVPA